MERRIDITQDNKQKKKRSKVTMLGTENFVTTFEKANNDVFIGTSLHTGFYMKVDSVDELIDLLVQAKENFIKE